MNKKILAVCDLETDYADRLAEYLAERQGFPFEVRTFSDVDRLLLFCREQKDAIQLLLISETAYRQELEKFPDIHIMILNESGKVTYSEHRNVDKYQPADHIVREVMCYCSDYLSESSVQPLVKTGTRIIGLYSPVKRCMQTSFALTLGQMLARQNRVLYLNLEGYSGFSERFYTEKGPDLTDLVFYAQTIRNKLLYRVESIVRKTGDLEYIPPVFSAADLQVISGEEWKELLLQLTDRCQYDYIILDLSDYVRGLFELLRMCHIIYTIIEDEYTAKTKLAEYEKDLEHSEYRDVLDKTRKCRLPWIEQLPQEAELLPFTKLADYVRSLLKDEAYGEL
ncbi:MAG: hypothetical protein J6B10_06900 [Lachnospiraceae bacterium]|nr:hypothetical protein [Lachnospiraceae bacterium]